MDGVAVAGQAVDALLDAVRLGLQKADELGCEALRVQVDLAGPVEEREDAADDLRREPRVEQAAAFTAVMTELLPAGLLPQMSVALGVPEG
ncbi:hypothetical protein, partial [Nonomuraea longispora]|uniref:hypothetical protein n=1 Tax=Nonomuraea longispora TaxID=1848320 RepID=UPI001404B2A6